MRLTGSISVARSSPDERRAVRALVGTDSSRVPLAALDAALRDAVGMGLVDWLLQLGPPLRDRVGERTEKAQRRSAVESLALDHPMASRPWFDEWMVAARRDGALATAARLEKRRYLEAALDVLGLVLGGSFDRIPFATLVARATGDTKRLASATVRALVEQALALEVGGARPASSAERRLLWRRFGILVDDVSSDVLVLNLRPDGDAPLARWLRDAADVGEPFRVTLRQLERAALTFDAAFPPTVVFVCENPAIVMDAATRLGARCCPLLCTEGVPSDAFWTVARPLVDAGVELRAHADFDASGCSIVGALVERLGARPWRFDSVAYRSALDGMDSRMVLPMSKGTPPPTPWDPLLREALVDDGRAVFEELVVESLVEDLD